MKTLLEYIIKECKGAGVVATPANTIGMGEPTTTDLVSAPAGGIPHEETRIWSPYYKKRKRKKLKDKLKDNVVQ